MDSPHQLVSGYARLFKDGCHLAPAAAKPAPRPALPHDAPRALIFSPHPDDECIVGGLALRLLRESQFNIVNIAVTLGSKSARRKERLAELKHACKHLGFDLLVANSGGLESVNAASRENDRAHWAVKVNSIAAILGANRPRVIFLPHEHDRHETHIGTHWLVMDALKQLPAAFECFVVETEFWGQMTTPNLLVEIGELDLTDLVAALSCHVGEVKRNAYHARLPAWMLDNVRRAEVVGGAGGDAPDFPFGTIYRLRKWSHGRMTSVLKEGKTLSREENPGELFL